MIIVTGGAGFIGANLIKGLNERGYDNILVVDNLTDSNKISNLAGSQITDFIDKDDFQRTLTAKSSIGSIRVIFHQGACSNTMEMDGRFMMRNNYTYSKQMLDFCAEQQIPLIYASSASVYGQASEFSEMPQFEQALNVYAYSKLLFDRYVRKRLNTIKSQVIGLRYFNVYGPYEQHKGKMASVAFHFLNQYQKDGRVRLFEGSDGYEDGEQRRDFIWVKDVVSVNLYFLEHPEKNGIYNVGTGRSQSFNEMAAAVINSRDETDRPISQLVSDGAIKYVTFPPELVGKYQSFTEADITGLRAAGYEGSFASVEEGVRQYINWRTTD